MGMKMYFMCRAFDGIFSLQVKPDSKPYQLPQRHVAYVLWKLFKEEWERLQQQYIIIHLGIAETANIATASSSYLSLMVK